MSHYDRFFAGGQIGGSVSGIGPIYKARVHYQRGRGLSDVFQGLWRYITPYLVSGSKALGKEALRAGGEILGNVGTQSIGNLLKQQSNKSLINLAEKAQNKINQLRSDALSGKGIKRPITVNEFIASLDKAGKTTKRKPNKKKKSVTKNKTSTKTKKTTTKKGKKKIGTRKKTKKTSKAAFLKNFLGK